MTLKDRRFWLCSGLQGVAGGKCNFVVVGLFVERMGKGLMDFCFFVVGGFVGGFVEARICGKV